MKAPFFVAGRVLLRKWKSLRDCFSRECQRLAKMKSGSAASRKTQYVFYNQLSFLQKVIKSKDTSSNLEEAAAAEIPIDDEEATTSSPGSSTEHRHKRKKVEKVEKVSSDVQQLVNVLQAGIQSREEREKSKEDDGDRLFLLSLLNPMKLIPEHLRFSVRMQMMQVIENATRNDMSSNIISDQPRQSNIQYQCSQQPQRQNPQQQHHQDYTLTPLQTAIHQYCTPIHSPASVSSPGTQCSQDSVIDNLFLN